MPDEATLVHELSHMWYGDSVTLTHVARHLAARGLRDLVGVDLERAPGNKSAAQCFKQLYNTPAQDDAFWTPPPGTPARPRACSTARSTTAAR